MNESKTQRFLLLAGRLAGMQLDDPDAFSVMHDLGSMTLTKHGQPFFDRLLIYQVEPVLARFLYSPEAECRRAALYTLICYWGLDTYVRLCKEMLTSDPDSSVRMTAAICLGDFYRHTHDTEVVALLKTRMQDGKEEELVRDAARAALRIVLS
jgi:HEAT repeat protein